MYSRLISASIAVCVLPAISVVARSAYELPAILPNGWVWGCYNISSTLPFCNPSLSIPDRIKDLISRLTLTEKMGFLGADMTTGVDNCNNMDAGLIRLGIPHYMNLVEVNTAVASACISENVCATEFVSPAGLAASFNRSVWSQKGQIISTELRAFNNHGWSRGMEAPLSKIGLTGFGPNINLVRDPRFGRNSELPSEDPFLTGSYAIEYVRGMQFDGDSTNNTRYLKMISGLKHYAFYTVETDRASFIPNITTFDMFDSYLPQYQMAFSDEYQLAPGGSAAAVMCSYAGANGVPSCANDFLLRTLVRDLWKRPDVLVVTDCGAINNMVSYNLYAPDPEMAAAETLNAGTDVDLGDMYFSPASVGGNDALNQAIAYSYTNESIVDEALTHIFTQRMRAGLFDPLNVQPYTKIGIDQINSTAHWQANLDFALQALVLLKNSNSTLPFKQGVKTAVIGPHIFSNRDLMEDYMGDQACADHTNNCIRTIAEVFTTMNGVNNTLVEKGVDFDSDDGSGIEAALDAVEAAAQIVLCLGTGNAQEHEGIDREDIALPGLQSFFASQVLDIVKQSQGNKKLVLVLINGGIISIDELVDDAPSIVEAFNPGMRGAEALFRSIFGLANRWGKLPVTIYPYSFIQQQSLIDFDMTKYPGRTYRYYQKTPLFKFGWGLSYTDFAISQCDNQVVDEADGLASVMLVSCQVANKGNREGDLVLQVYHSVSDSLRARIERMHPVPIQSLVEFTRHHLPTRQTATIIFKIPMQRFALTNNQGEKVLYYGDHLLIITDGTETTTTLDFMISSTMTQ